MFLDINCKRTPISRKSWYFSDNKEEQPEGIYNLPEIIQIREIIYPKVFSSPYYGPVSTNEVLTLITHASSELPLSPCNIYQIS